MDDVNCLGSETRIEDCTHGGWGTHNCGHGEDISISCIPSKKSFLFISSFFDHGNKYALILFIIYDA